jgi:hypothetical protein
LISLWCRSLEYLFGDDERAAAVINVGLTNGKRTTILEGWKVFDGKIRFGRVYWFDPSVLDD